MCNCNYYCVKKKSVRIIKLGLESDDEDYEVNGSGTELDKLKPPPTILLGREGAEPVEGISVMVVSIVSPFAASADATVA